MDNNLFKQHFLSKPDEFISLFISLTQKVDQLSKEVEVLRAENIELISRLNKNSQNSSKPPSSDGYKKNNINSRQKSNRKSGGQKGHKGSTLRLSKNPDEIIEHYPLKCTHCSKFKECKETFSYCRNQVHDIVRPVFKITEHRTFSGKCCEDNAFVKGCSPLKTSTPVSYGENIRTLVILLKEYQLIPYSRTCEFLEDVWGINISEGTILNIEEQYANNLDAYNDDLLEIARNADVLHSDETGIRVIKQLFWLHTYSTDFFTFYSCHKKRGKEAMDAIGVLAYFVGILCHDFWGPYFKNNCKHSMCNAHILRELKAMLELYGEQWADELISILIEMKKRVDLSADNKLSKHLYTIYKNKWLSLIEKAINEHPPPENSGKRGRPKKGKILCLLERLRDYADDILRFSKESCVPFDNNQAERDLRMIKTKQKISGCFRSEKGAESFCKIRSYISTVRKQGKNVFEAIQLAVSGIPRFSS